MANTQDLKAKELLEKNSIRTMRKDLQKLREIDSLQESRRIVQLKAPVPNTQEKPVPTKKSVLVEEKSPSIREKIEALFKEKKEKDEEIMRQAKAKATELEKQQIFALESQKAVVQNQQISNKKETKPAFGGEKSSIALEQENIRKKLKPVVQEEGNLQAKIKGIEEKEKTSNASSEKQSLEQQRWKLEEQRQKVEKEEWLLEKRLQELGKKVQEINAHHQKIEENEQEKKAKMVALEDSLRQVHSDILKRSEAQQLDLPPKEKPLIVQKEEVSAKKEVPPEEQKKPLERPGKALHQEVPPQLKEKLRQSVKTEEIQRKKFLEDVEAWVTASKKNKEL